MTRTDCGVHSLRIFSCLKVPANLALTFSATPRSGFFVDALPVLQFGAVAAGRRLRRLNTFQTAYSGRQSVADDIISRVASC